MALPNCSPLWAKRSHFKRQISMYTCSKDLSEMEKDAMVLALHVLHLPFVCGKTLAEE